MRLSGSARLGSEGNAVESLSGGLEGCGGTLGFEESVCGGLLLWAGRNDAEAQAIKPSHTMRLKNLVIRIIPLSLRPRLYHAAQKSNPETSSEISILCCFRFETVIKPTVVTKVRWNNIVEPLLLMCLRPTPDRDQRPDRLNQSKWPCALHKSIDGAERASAGKRQNVPPAARFQCIANEHG